MHSDLHLHFAHAAADERRGERLGRRRHFARGLDATLSLRLAGADEHDAVERLAALDGAAPLEGRVLLALADGEPVAALDLDDGRVVADPFAPSADAVALLQVRARGAQRPPRRLSLRAAG